MFAVQISAQHSPYRDALAIQGVGINSETSFRQAALAQAWGLYRSINGPFVLGRGSIFTLTYMDGSSERAMVNCTTASSCIVIVTGSQSPPPDSGGNSGGTGGTGGGSGAGGSSGPGPTPVDPPSTSPGPINTIPIRIDVPGGIECTLPQSTIKDIA